MARIERMERGKLCPMSGRPYYNHQTWQDGKNVVRYVPAGEAAFVSEAIKGYELFRKLAEEYADEVVRQTRAERAKEFPKAKNSSRSRTGNQKASKSQGK